MKTEDIFQFWESLSGSQLDASTVSNFLNNYNEHATKNIIHVQLSCLFKRATENNLRLNEATASLLKTAEKAGYEIRVIPLGRHITTQNPARDWIRQQKWNLRANNSGFHNELKQRISGDKMLASVAIVDLERINFKELKEDIKDAHKIVINPKQILSARP